MPGALVGDMLDYALGFVAPTGLFFLALFSLTCWFSLQNRVVHTSRAVADRQFPLFVGAVALVAGALAVAIGGVVAFGVAGAVIVVCVGCLVVEAFDRASPIGSYLGGVAITLAAGGGSVAAFALLCVMARWRAMACWSVSSATWSTTTRRRAGSSALRPRRRRTRGRARREPWPGAPSAAR